MFRSFFSQLLSHKSILTMQTSASNRRVPKRTAKRALRLCDLRLERLEERALLSVSTFNYEAIRDAWPALNLPETADEVNVIYASASAESLQEAIVNASRTNEDDLIVVDVDDYSEIMLPKSSMGYIYIDVDSSSYGALNIVALGEQPLKITALQCCRAFTIINGNVGLANMTITGGKNDEGLEAFSVENHTGGGIFLNRGELTTVDVTISNNHSSYGGGVYVAEGSFTAVNTTFRENSCIGDGGGVYVDSGTFTATNATFVDNFAYRGGGVYVGSGAFTATNTTISEKNSYVGSGAGVYVADGSFTAVNTTITGVNDYFGGGVYVDSGSFTAINSAITESRAHYGGGGVYVSRGAFTAINTTIAGNSSHFGAGGVQVESEGTFTAKNTIVSENYGPNLTGTLSTESSNNLIGYYPSFACSPEFDQYGVLVNTPWLELSGDSAAIDAGDNDVIEEYSTDLDGYDRVCNATVDIGACEYMWERFEPTYSTVVDTLNDSFDLYDDEWSLREAIYYASKYKTITFAEGLSGTITLTLGELLLDKALEIDGAGLITIDADQRSRVMKVTSGTTDIPVVLKGLTIQNGKEEDDGDDSQNYLLDGYHENDSDGGGIFLTGGALTVSNVTITQNSAKYGGGVYVYSGTFTSINSTISQNNATEEGGGVYVDKHGMCSATNTILAGNVAKSGGGVFIFNDGTYLATNTTITGNSAENCGGVGVLIGNFIATNTIIATNYGGNLPVEPSFGTNNIIDDDPGFICGPVFDDWGLLTNAEALDLHLSPASSAIDAGSNDAVIGIETDFDGNARIYNDVVDIGAYEYQIDVSFSTIVDTLNDSFNLNDGEWSLREALCYASEYTTITFAENLNGTIVLERGELKINTPIIIDGDDRITIDANGKSRVMNVNAGTTEQPTVLKGLTIQGGVIFEDESLDSSGDMWDFPRTSGGGIYLGEGALEATNVTIMNNSASGWGGGVFVGYCGTFTATDSIISGNFSSEGAGVYVDGGARHNSSLESDSVGTFTCVNSTLSDNNALFGGGIAGDGNIDLTSATIKGNKGGGFWCYRGVITATDSIVTENTTDYSGGGVFIYDGTFTAENTTISKNSATGYNEGLGGGVFVNDGVFTATNSTITENEANSGGGIFVRNAGTITTSNSTISNNKASGNGGGVYFYYESYDVEEEGTFTAENTKFMENQAESGGGVYVGYGTFVTTNSTFSGNYADYDGGGIYVDYNGSVETTTAILENNHAQNGGGIYDVGSVTITNAVLAGNFADYGGGAYVSTVGNFTAINATIAGNSAQNEGGGVYVEQDGGFWATNVVNSLNYGSNLTGALSSDSSKNIIDDDPLFVCAPEFDAQGVLTNKDAFDLRLRAGSPAIDAGINEYIEGVSVDVNGNPRISNGVVDIGAYEYVVEKPNAPGGISVGVYNAATRTVEISWQDNSNCETGFRVEYSTDGGKTWRLSQIMSANVTSRVAWGVKANATYNFRVCAINAATRSDWAYSKTLDTTVVTPAPPSALTLGEYDATSRTVAMSWRDNSADETGYRVEYSTDGGKTWRLSQIMGANVTSRVAWSVKTNATYNFRVCALQGALKSKWAYSETLDTSEDAQEAFYGPIFMARALTSCGCAPTLPGAVSSVKQVAVRDVAFEEFAKDDAFDAFDFSDEPVQKNVETSDEAALLAEPFDDLLDVEFFTA